MKGRNPNLIQLRNYHLIRRYYFWHDIQRIRRDDVLSILSEKEIFLDEEYISRLIYQHDHLLKEIRRAKPTERKLNDFQFGTMPVQAYVNGDLFAGVN